jgi:predicted enzyme related to lactoylglutathione lyase
MADTSSRHHTFDYVELAAADIPAAKKFYADAFGWSFNDYGPAYSGIRRPSGEGEIGGLNPERPAGPGLPLAILYSDDLDATYAAVQAAVSASGGSIDEEPFEFPGGRRFHFSDPAGNMLAVWQQAEAGQAG